LTQSKKKSLTTDPSKDEIVINQIIKKKKIVNNLIIKWTKMNLRDFPWRRDRTPYKVFISELLLQRTKSEQVEPIYEEFLRIFPDPTFIEPSKKNKIDRLLDKLGLLKRADMIIETFKAINNDYESKIPSLKHDLLALKGVGKYTASATLCFGFNQRIAILDANVYRIYNRLFGVKPKTKTVKNDKFLWEFCQKMLPKDNYIMYNYGLLDLGGMICKAKAPKCNLCPLNSICKYYSS